jgi:hypothetical protein
MGQSIYQQRSISETRKKKKRCRTNITDIHECVIPSFYFAYYFSSVTPLCCVLSSTSLGFHVARFTTPPLFNGIAIALACLLFCVLENRMDDVWALTDPVDFEEEDSELTSLIFLQPYRMGGVW